MIVRDWREADVADTQLLYAREQDFWVRELTWDASNSWREIEQARTTWGLPGYLAIDSARTLRGWAYYLPEGETVLMTAARVGKVDAVKTLLVGGAKVNARDSYRGETALHLRPPLGRE